MNTREISSEEENKMYQIINDALFALCEEKPNNPIDYLARKMLELAGVDPHSISSKKKNVKSKNQEDLTINVNRLLYGNKINNIFEENFKIIENMGNKQFGNIHLVEEIKSGKKKTAYIIRKEKISNKNLTENNIAQLLEIDHVNLTKIYDIFEDYNFIYIIREYCSGGTLLSFLLKNKCCNENLVKIIIKQIINGVNYLHSLNPPIILGDIELTHIYIYQEEENLNNIIVKLSDFPNAFIGKGLGESDKHFFVPPEIIKGSPKTIKSDTWSIGAIAYTLLAGEPPYNGKEHEIIYKIINNDIEYKELHSEEAIDFLSRFLVKDPNFRQDLSILLKNKWLSNIQVDKVDETVSLNIINKMTKFAMGKGLKKSVLSYIYTRKLYSENNSELQKLFNEIDINGDGTIDFDEFVDKYSRYFTGTKREVHEKITKFFDSIDMDKTGGISYSEFLTVNSVMNKELCSSTLKQVFDYYDFDHNGYIEADDIREIFEDANIQDDQFQKIIDEYDVNGDKKISFEEFFNMIVQYY